VRYGNLRFVHRHTNLLNQRIGQTPVGDPSREGFDEPTGLALNFGTNQVGDPDIVNGVRDFVGPSLQLYSEFHVDDEELPIASLLRKHSMETCRAQTCDVDGIHAFTSSRIALSREYRFLV